MTEGDALFVLRAVRHFVPERPPRPRPQTLFGSAEEKDWARCEPEGVEGLWLPFEHQGQLYEAFAAARPVFSGARATEIEAIWKSLRLSPIRTGADRADIGRPYSHEISTHCGITGTAFAGREWTADPPLIQDEIGPPDGWDNPTELGTIVLESERAAVFTSRFGGRTARFRPWVANDPPLGMCE